MKRTLNNNGDNSSLPPSANQKGKPSNTYNTREKSVKKPGGQRGHAGTTRTEQEVIDKINSVEYKHTIVRVGTPFGRYVSKYVIDLEVNKVVTEMRFYEDGQGNICIPDQYHSDVTYGSAVIPTCTDSYRPIRDGWRGLDESTTTTV